MENFLHKFGLKIFFSKFRNFFCLKRFTKDRSLTSLSDRPIHSPICHIRALFIFWKIEEKKFFSNFFLNCGFVPFGCIYWGCRRGVKSSNIIPLTYFGPIKIASVDQKLWTFENWVGYRSIWRLFLEAFSEELRIFGFFQVKIPLEKIRKFAIFGHPLNARKSR